MTKHDFIAYRDDRAGDSQPISFDGERWLAYVPLRLPWTLMRSRAAAPGAAAGLSTGLTLTPISLSLNAAQERVFSAIDGKRPSTNFAGGRKGECSSQGREFFERLWRYDQIVFDATGSG